jgi:hypothetical protein
MNPIYVTKQQVSAVALMLANDEDEQLKLDTLEGETNLFEVVRSLLGAIEEDEGIALAVKHQIEQRQARKSAAEHRNEVRREAIRALLDCAGLDKLTLPEATLSVRKVAPKAIISDEAAVPDSLCRFKRAPDMAAIKAEVEAGRAVSGVTLDNGGSSLTIRRK